MPEEDAPTVVTTQSDMARSGRHAEVAADPADDWLAEESDLDWFPPSEAVPRRRQRSGASALPAVSSEVHAEPEPVADVFRRRRAIALVAILAVIAIAVLVPLLMLGGGGQTTATTQSVTTTPVNTTPATTPASTLTTTTTASTTTATSPTSTTPSSGSATVTLPASGTLRSGDTNEQVKSLQQALNTLAVGQTLAVDGIYGPLTQQEVTAFQQANGLTVDGVVGAQTAQALNAALAAKG